jgi:hypothetical protein
MAVTYKTPHYTELLDRRPIPWTSRGVGLDAGLVCFVCGTEWRNEEAKARGNDYLNNIAAHLTNANKEAAFACFDIGARMDYYHGDPSSPQIKVGACDEHKDYLKHLADQWFISAWKVHDLVRTYRLTLAEKIMTAALGYCPRETR